MSMLKHSWGNSKVLELTLTDYISALTAASSDNSSSSRAGLLSSAAAGLRHSAAPLRNMAKDMHCVVGELTAEELGPVEGSATATTTTTTSAAGGNGTGSRAKARLPVLAASHEAIQKACSQEVSERYTLSPH